MLLHHAAVFVFWISGALLFYTFIGYGLLMSLLASSRRKATPISTGDAPPPLVDVVLVACNEEKNISSRLRNLLASSYPVDKLRIILVSDGSTDGTVAAARALNEARIEVIECPQRSGKAPGLNLA